jgi:hypothetical protein
MQGILFRQEEKTYCKDAAMVNKHRGFIIHKTGFKKGRIHDYMLSI